MPTKKKKTSRTKSQKVGSKKAAPKKRISANTAPQKSSGSLKSSLGRGKRRTEEAPFEPEELRSRSGGQAGSLQGLSDVSDADSESVDELLEEGNAYEAEAVEGVEDASDADEGEVRTHETPEDDVPEEYIDHDE